MPAYDPFGALLVNADMAHRYSGVTKVASYTATVSDDTILCNGTLTVTLPLAATSDGVRLQIKNIGTGVVTIDGNGSDTIDGNLTITLSVQYEAVELMCIGSAWWIV